MAKTRSVEIQMQKILDEYSDKVNGVLKATSREVANEAEEKLRSSSPTGYTGRYAQGWTVSEKNGGYVVHNATDYQLTHLLENSHVIKNKYGEYGRTSRGHGQVVHIKPVETWANKEFQRRIEEGLR